MDKLNDIEMEFASKALIKGGVFLLDASNAINFILRCREKRYLIFGIDGFFLQGDKIQPSIDNSVDFGKQFTPISDELYEQAMQFLKDKDKRLYFEVVCGEP